MTSLFKQFKTDSNRETDGVFLEYGLNDRTQQPITIRVARAGGSNTKFQRVLEAKLKPYRRLIQTDTLDNKTAERVMREAFAEAVVIGWENVDDEHGNPLPFTVENCIKLFEALPDLFRDVQSEAQRVTLFRQDVLERDAGN